MKKHMLREMLVLDICKVTVSILYGSYCLAFLLLGSIRRMGSVVERSLH